MVNWLPTKAEINGRMWTCYPHPWAFVTSNREEGSDLSIVSHSSDECYAKECGGEGSRTPYPRTEDRDDLSVGELVTEISRHVYRPRMLITKHQGRSLSGSAYPNNAGRSYQRRCAEVPVTRRRCRAYRRSDCRIPCAMRGADIFHPLRALEANW